MINNKRYRKEVYQRNPPGSADILADKVVGICGAGGLGSNIVVSLLRAGIQHFIIADFDTVERSNLNRQFYFLDQIGMTKVDALHQSLVRINPHVQTTLHQTKVTEENFSALFAEVDIMVEAFDDPEQKAMVANSCLRLFPDRFIVMGSGLSGYGKNFLLETTVCGKLVICGDQQTSASPENGLAAPRLGIVAQMQANVVLEILLDGRVTS